ncbi:MAG: bacteriocin family protein [Drouetiella hepatica Uher 2000/2452]|jgi:uncharacterized linocin/CFP29 family protein|uniref:Type 1 encapsulin shell protein n=1 Tax=Drouetiella hepatica Uher 2000/2452 TaxID=904376 RepID=A0A951QF54_9CYAN|nr:bacteriocin family protein [Drouetiella hepatica Uher 2000/2452]
MSNSNEVNWDQAVWQEINDAVKKEMAKVRKAQMVIPTMSFDNNPTEIQNDVINFVDLSIQEGLTKNFVEIYQEFSLTSAQVSKETEHKTCKTLARMAAKAIALAEDAYFFQLSDRAPELRNPDDRQRFQVRLPGGVKISNWNAQRDFGLLAEANPPDADDNDINKVTFPISVDPAAANVINVTWGEETFKAVTKGIAKLVSKGQATNYALFLSTDVYADTFAPPSPASLVTTADRIKPLVEGGFYDSAVLPQNEGLLIALAGEPQKLFVGTDAYTEFIRKEGAKYFFRVVERVQYVVRDPRSLVLLKFNQRG